MSDLLDRLRAELERADHFIGVYGEQGHISINVRVLKQFCELAVERLQPAQTPPTETAGYETHAIGFSAWVDEKRRALGKSLCGKDTATFDEILDAALFMELSGQPADPPAQTPDRPTLTDEQLLSAAAKAAWMWDHCQVCWGENNDAHDSLPHVYEGATDKQIADAMRLMLALAQEGKA